ncbi:DUF2304 domain-containing protein [Paenibacillus sp. GbtcB18]|uniref:DUF2304 domain-containing protein n=1 Tax=Paenibacillus sp. GbtcB18 TaxID=2824763 RepID=UPI001C3107E9|nr:DUF2304 domain-containing protein [Paenibacillus sp. GbtcB18]
MTASIFYICFALSLAFSLVILGLIRKKRLREQYSLLWLGLSGLMMLVSLFPKGLDRIAGILQVSYAPSLLYVLAILAIMSILLHVTLVVSALTDRTITLAQTLSLYEEQLRQLKGQSEGHKEAEPPDVF